MSNKTKGILLIIAAAFGFAMMNTFVKLSGELPVLQKSFFRNAIAFIFALSILLKRKKKFSLPRANIPWMALRSVCGTVAILCNFYAVDHLILANASILAKLAPFFAVLMSCLLLREKPRFVQVLLVVGAFVGSWFLINPTFDAVAINIPSVVAVVGAFIAGTAYTVVRKLGAMGQDGTTIILCFSAFSCLVSLPFLVFDYHPMSWQQLMFLLLAGLAATLGQFSVTNAYILAPAREISVFDYTQVVFAAIFGFALYGEMPSLANMPGYLLILCMGILAFLSKQPPAKESSSEENATTKA